MEKTITKWAKKYFFPYISNGAVPISEPELIEGDALILDISMWQNNIVWDSVFFNGIDGFIIKATEGVGFVNQLYDQQWAGAESIGSIKSSYHWYSPFVDGDQQAVWFIKNAKRGDIPPAMDFEDTSLVPGAFSISQQVNNALKFLNRVEKEWGQRPGIYSGAWYMNPRFGKIPEFDMFWKWPAHYKPVDKKGPDLPLGWTDNRLWQYGSTMEYRGIFGPVDTNICLMGRKYFYDWAKMKPNASRPTPQMRLRTVYGGRYVFELPNMTSKVLRTIPAGTEVPVTRRELPWVNVGDGWVLHEKLYTMFL